MEDISNVELLEIYEILEDFIRTLKSKEEGDKNEG